MSWSRDWMLNFWTAREFDDIETKMRLQRRRDSSLRRNAKKQAEDMEDDLGHLLLLTRALAEVCIKKGVLTRNDLASMINQMDSADGVMDGKIDPNALKEQEKRENPKSRSKRAKYKRR